MKKLFQIVSFPGSASVQPVLAFRIGEKHCSFAITDLASGELKQLAYYTCEDPDDNFVQEVFANHPELNETYYQVLVSFDHCQSTFIPLKYFNHEDGPALMKLMFDANGSSTIVSESIAEWQLYNVYAVPQQLHGWLNRKFPSGKYWHQNSIGLRKSRINAEGLQILIDFRVDDFNILVFDGGTFIFSQSYPYSTPEDVLYYLLKVSRRFAPEEKISLGISGFIDRQSALFKELHQYFHHIEFREPIWKIPGDEHPPHFFTSLNDLTQCAL